MPLPHFHPLSCSAYDLASQVLRKLGETPSVYLPHTFKLSCIVMSLYLFCSSQRKKCVNCIRDNLTYPIRNVVPSVMPFSLVFTLSTADLDVFSP